MRTRKAAALACAAAVLLPRAPAARAAGTFTVTTTAELGPGSLFQAVRDANAAGGGTINIVSGGAIGLSWGLPVITTPITVNGNNVLIRGMNNHRAFFVDAPAGASVALNNLTIYDTTIHGGHGVNGGGGGLGAGAGVFVSRGNVTLANVNFVNNRVEGGNGGVGFAGHGGGGGLGGNGGEGLGGGGGGYLGAGGNADGTGNRGGGGGGVGGGQGETGNGGAGNSIIAGGGGGGGIFPGNDGASGGAGGSGGGGNGGSAGGGGGGSPASPGATGAPLNGGAGGRFGGGGGTATFSNSAVAGNGGDYGGGGAGGRGGNGGFGGGGGSGKGVGGNGGFGAGGGGASGAFGFAGAFAGDGNSLPAGGAGGPGGGGAALGGQVFVRPGATLTLLDTAAESATLFPGVGGTTRGGVNLVAGHGATAGASFFLAGPTTISVSAGLTRTVSGSIDDATPALAHPTAAGYERARLTKTGPGTLLLGSANNFYGGLVVSQGAVSGATADRFGQGTNGVVLNDPGTGAADTALLVASGVFFHPIVVANHGSGTTTIGTRPGASAPAIFDRPITLQKDVTLVGENASSFPASHDGGQTRFEGAITGPGGVTIKGPRAVQFRAGAKTYAGPTRVLQGATFSQWNSSSTPANSTVDIEFGAVVVLEGLDNGLFGGLSGPGTLSHNASYPASKLRVGNNNADTTFTGGISNTVLLEKVGAGTLEIGRQDNLDMHLTVSSGRVRLLGDHRLSGLALDKAAAGTQALDLAGQTMRFSAYPLSLPTLERALHRNVGAAADGIYDSTAVPGLDVGVAYPTAEGVLMRLTISGDANLDRLVDFNDLVALAQNYNTADGFRTWDEGDFTHDGNIDFNDLVKLAQNYNTGYLPAAVPGGSAAGFEQDLRAAFAAVPEPTATLPVAGLTLLLRHRRRRG